MEYNLRDNRDYQKCKVNIHSNHNQLMPVIAKPLFHGFLLVNETPQSHNITTIGSTTRSAWVIGGYFRSTGLTITDKAISVIITLTGLFNLLRKLFSLLILCFNIALLLYGYNSEQSKSSPPAMTFRPPAAVSSYDHLEVSSDDELVTSKWFFDHADCRFRS